MDLSSRGCHMCSDWPCVLACEPGALGRKQDDLGAFPKLAKVTINEDTCLPYQGPECGACAGCALCREACITIPNSITIHLNL